ncbi:hypothetical protein FH972_005410 [Carpinus fangiana]|uniref:Uncharacterized protein n=1 Tax=Carpinus fangiana TaxID=176857 RepID=A0A5N6QSP3_9ROSI|nr:hypothetical protein FH972_005410 [Carpinus fangiana]
MATHIEDLKERIAQIKKDDVNTEWRAQFLNQDYTLPPPKAEWMDLPNEDACKLGRSVMPRLNSGISRRSIASLFILAAQLRAPGMGNTPVVFDLNDCPTFAISDRQYSDYEDDAIIELGETTAVTEKIGKTRDIAKAYAFLAASILRLFSTSPENYILAWNHIVRGFETFYNPRCPISDVNPKLQVIKAIHKQILDDTFRDTLCRILWMLNSDSDQLSLKRFLYDIHLSHTGKRILPIFVRLCTALNCSTAVMMFALRTPEYDRQLGALKKVLSYTNDNGERRKRKLRKYGRIFDQSFMSANNKIMS